MRTSKLSSSTTYPFICSFNGSGVNTNVGLKADIVLKRYVLAQIGQSAADLFQDDFINYNKGFILCQNTDVLLNKMFSSAIPVTQVFANLRNTISFTVVRMPSTFVGQKGNLSKNYEYGEKLKVSVSLEPLDDEGTGKPPSSQQSEGPIKDKKRGVLFLVYRDANISSRTLKSQSGGGGIGVWS